MNSPQGCTSTGDFQRVAEKARREYLERIEVVGNEKLSKV